MVSTLVNLFADDAEISRVDFGDGFPSRRSNRAGQRGSRVFRHEGRRFSSIPLPGAETAAEINAALENSGYRLSGIRCRCSNQGLVLVGEATCYYHVQVALTTAMRLAGSRRVLCQVKVVSRHEMECCS